jgi:hypothetical protein
MEKHDTSDYEETRAVGRLPNLDIEIIHRSARQGQDEYLSVTMRATPSFEAIGHMLEAANPLLFWTHWMRAAWSPWAGLLGGWGVPSQIRRDHGSKR